MSIGCLQPLPIRAIDPLDVRRVLLNQVLQRHKSLGILELHGLIRIDQVRIIAAGNHNAHLLLLFTH
ncbi:hypothetical protein D3C75_1261710 [compost metagenome]